MDVTLTAEAGHYYRYIVKLPRENLPQLPSSSLSREALRTGWADENKLGPKLILYGESCGGLVLERLPGEALNPQTAPKWLPQIAGLLRRFHSTKAAAFMERYDPIKSVRGYLDIIKANKTMPQADMRLIDGVLVNTGNKVKGHPWVPCHNDLHCQNIMLNNIPQGEDGNQVVAIDFEDCDLADPMWDLAYFTVNLGRENCPRTLMELYGVSKEEERRYRAYLPLAVAHCAAWAGMRGGDWLKHCGEMMVRLRTLLGKNSRTEGHRRGGN
ncbi:uncharacterized protein KY384_008648 [Bacidia gigantensis]|uniref:uncharacterized protein n=1 Tax=Bacidia gigantensis TaxID=2732470 RepID=UPI001D050F9F|nr:uncharacterized protein KY384_008648 [Bacidia gigantensis]KAG8527218.1 hypothetical protein KY384_008648 [Bacidia gigantensis]